MAACDYVFVKEKARMEKALEIVHEAKKMLDDMYAENLHELSKCMDAKAMVLCAELFFEASLLRKESRGFHYREDFPDSSDEWMKWMIFCKKEEGWEVSYENVKREQYDY